nr:putative reverse transcriptase domain-containing protein [Tanacetum cinerariifolium]
AKTTSWNKFSSTMAFAIICLATNQKFNFSRYILLSLVKNIKAGVPLFMFPRVGIGFSGEVTLLFDNMLVQAPEEKQHKLKRKHTKEPEVPPTKSQAEHNVPLPLPSHDPLPSGKDSLKLKKLMDLCTSLSNKVLDLEFNLMDIKSTCKAKIEKLESRIERLEEENIVLKELKGVYSIVDSDEPVMLKEESSKQGRKIADIDADVQINLEKVQAEAYNLDLDHQEKVLSMLDVIDEEPAGVEEVVEVFTAAKLKTKVVTTAGVDKRGVIIQDPEETTTTVTVQLKVQANDKRKAILVKEPKPLKKQVQIDLDEEVARQLEAELNIDINWNAVIEQVKRSKRLTDAVMKYQALKRKPLTEAQARRNMIVYLKNMAGYKMNYFKGMRYDEIRPLFEKHYNYNQAFLNETKVSSDQVLHLGELFEEFPDVFPEELPGLPPVRQVEFQIDLIPGAAPVARAPYRLAPLEMQELSNQLQELEDQGFIRPNQEMDFQILKQKLCEAPILALPEGNDDFVFYCDASIQAQTEALKEENVQAENLRGMEKAFEIHTDGTHCIKNQSW